MSFLIVQCLTARMRPGWRWSRCQMTDSSLYHSVKSSRQLAKFTDVTGKPQVIKFICDNTTGKNIFQVTNNYFTPTICHGSLV